MVVPNYLVFCLLVKRREEFATNQGQSDPIDTPSISKTFTPIPLFS